MMKAWASIRIQLFGGIASYPITETTSKSNKPCWILFCKHFEHVYYVFKRHHWQHAIWPRTPFADFVQKNTGRGEEAICNNSYLQFLAEIRVKDSEEEIILKPMWC